MYSILKVVKKSQHYSVKECDIMKVLRIITIGIIALIAGLLFGLVLYVIMGGDTTDPTWEKWMYGPCYFVPFSALILGLFTEWRKNEE